MFGPCVSGTEWIVGLGRMDQNYIKQRFQAALMQIHGTELGQILCDRPLINQILQLGRCLFYINTILMSIKLEIALSVSI